MIQLYVCFSPEVKLEQIRGVIFLYSYENLIYNHDENLLLIVIFQILVIFVGASLERT
jgi:hypothetical protein